MEVVVGLRVVRGPDWKWGEQDGGEGHLGTVAEMEAEGSSVVVQWDCGFRCRYRCGGQEGRFDLRVYDTAPAGMKYPLCRCLGCKAEGIEGMLWRCVKCSDYYLCNLCYMGGRHSLEHEFLRIEEEEQLMRTHVIPRGRSRRLEVKGIFPGAQVVRGHSWRWKNQDGGPGQVGKVVSIMGWRRESARSVAEVEWSANQRKNMYRVGHNGKTDLKCTLTGRGRGGWYYPDHLPVLGAPHQPQKERDFAAGDKVMVELDPDVWKYLQQDHGGWNDHMSMFIGVTGTVKHIDDSGDLMVNYMSSAMFHINPEAVTKVVGGVFRPGDIVCVVDDMVEVMKYQKGHGEWNDEMALTLGQVGRVVKRLPQGDYQVSISGRRWIYNPQCLKPAPGEKPPLDYHDDTHVSALTRAQLESLMEKMNPDLVPIAASAGDATTLKDFLERCPAEVNAKMSGKTALHLAAAEGYIHVLKTLLEFRPDLDIEDDTGERPLHYAIHLNQEEATKLLIDAGADVNARNSLGLCPLTLATASGSCGILKILASCPTIDVNAQDVMNNTALHMAVLAHKSEAVGILLDAGADLTIRNGESFTPILEAAKNGFYAGMEQFMERYPQHVNMLKGDDGHTALHIAAANNHLDIIQLLASMDTCDLDAKNIRAGLTALHIATQRGYSRVLEFLLGYGADPNIADHSGQTILHMILASKDMMPPSTDGQTPELEKVQSQLAVLNGGNPVEPYVTVTCFLAKEGANLYAQNDIGVPPLALCSDDALSVITTYTSEQKVKEFHGTLPRSHPATPQGAATVQVRSHLQAPVHREERPTPDIVGSNSSFQPNLASLGSSSGGAVLAGGRKPAGGWSLGEGRRLGRGDKDEEEGGSGRGEGEGGGGHKDVVTLGSGSEAPGSGTVAVPPLGDMYMYSGREVSTDSGSGRSKPALPLLDEPGSSGQTPDPEESQCILCEDPADTKFEPCGHIAMCSNCAHRAKRCPHCHEQVFTKSKLPG